MKRLIVTVGCSGSGKSTWAEEYCRDNFAHEVNRDIARFGGTKKDWTKYKFTKANETRVTEMCHSSALVAATVKADIIVSDTNLNANYRQRWKEFADTYGYEYQEKPFIKTWEELRTINSQREGGISENILWNQFLNMCKYLGKRTYERDDGNKKAIIIDIDGTVAEMKGRGPFEWDKVKHDAPRPFVIAMIQGVIEQTGARPVFLSGRDGCCYQDTRNWIADHFRVGYVELYMRPEGDCRKDYIVKEELFWNHIGEKYDVVGVFDDRPQVLGMWRQLGLPNIIDVSGDRYAEF